MTPLSTQLRIMRLRADLKQRELGDAVGMPNTSISLYETGRRVPSEEQIKALTSACGITPADLYAIVPRWDEIEESHRWERVPVKAPTVERVRRVVDPLAALISDDSPYPSAQCSLRGAW